MRCDFNVPQDENLNITDETRILGALPTIKYLKEHGAAVILCSHLGRPKGKFNPNIPSRLLQSVLASCLAAK